MEKNVHISDLSERNAELKCFGNVAVFKSAPNMLNKCTLPAPQYGILCLLLFIYSLRFLIDNVWLLVQMQDVFLNPDLAILPDEWMEYCRNGLFFAEMVFVMSWAFLYVVTWHKNDMSAILLMVHVVAMIAFVLYFAMACTVMATADRIGMALWGDWRQFVIGQLIVVLLFFILKAEFQRERLRTRLL